MPSLEEAKSDSPAWKCRVCGRPDLSLAGIASMHKYPRCDSWKSGHLWPRKFAIDEASFSLAGAMPEQNICRGSQDRLL